MINAAKNNQMSQPLLHKASKQEKQNAVDEGDIVELQQAEEEEYSPI
jgi:hypothetical protein